ncbi:DUF6440 family protein [Blautia sp. Marseille-P3201T]
MFQSKENRFEVDYKETGFASEKVVYVDKDADVNYLFIASGI